MYLIAGFGNPLLDITIKITDYTLLNKYHVNKDEQIEVSASAMTSLLKDIEPFPQHISAGGCAQNTLRVFQWLIQRENASIYFGGIGNDEQSVKMKGIVEKSGVITRYITNENELTGTCVALVKDTTRCLIAHIGAASIIPLASIANPGTSNILHKTHIIYMEGFFLTNRIDVASYIKNLAQRNSIFCFNLSGVYICDLLPENMIEFAKSSHIVFGNKSEFLALGKYLQLTTIKDVALFLNKCYEASEIDAKYLRFRKIVIVTDGANSIFCVYNNGDVIEVPVFKIDKDKIEDTTGAGDSFVAGFLAGFIEGFAIKKCIQFGSWTANQIIQQQGCTIPNFIPDLNILESNF